MNTLDIEMLGTDRVSRLLRCTPQLVEEEARKGELPGLKFGRAWIFPRRALLQVLNDQAIAQAISRRDPIARPALVAAKKIKPRERRRPLPVLVDLPGHPT
jgi:hypothetical protein